MTLISAGYRRLQAEVSANAEKAAPRQSGEACDSRKLQMALSVQPLKLGT
jgi:hypothetical protein